jgi:hypothetical protein
MSKKDYGVKIPVLDRENYFHWKVKMRLHLMSIDEGFVDCIDKGPHVPMKAASRVGLAEDAPDTLIPKPVSEWSLENIAEVHKDKKTMNILFNGLETEMLDNVINCTTSKEVWDIVQTLCEGTEQVRENKMQLLIQQYEHFHFKNGETLNDTFSRFQKLLNGLKLYGRIYQVKDSNLKFLRSLPKEWKPMTVSLRNTQEYKTFTLERLYGTLKTYELEMEQDEEIEKAQKKTGTVALVANLGQLEEKRTEAAQSTPNREVCEGRTESSRGKEKVSEELNALQQEELDEIDEHLAFLSRRFSKLKFKRNSGVAKPFNKDFSTSNFVDKSKIKCFNCGIAGHMISECRKPRSENKGKSTEAVDYKKKYFDLLRQKGKAFMTQEYDWAAEGDHSDDDTEYVNLALMADSGEQEASSASNQVFSTNLSELTKEECNSVIDEMSTELYHLSVTLKSLTKENNRIKESNLLLSDRNAALEIQFLEFEKMRVDCKDAKNELGAVLKREQILREQLEKEQGIIAKFQSCRNIAQNIVEVQGIESFVKKTWTEKKKELEPCLEDLETICESTDSDHPLTDEPSTDERYPLTNKKSVSKRELKKLDSLYGPVAKNFVSGECSKDKSSEKAKAGDLLNKKAVGKLINEKIENEGKKKKNRNGKIGINKNNNYTPDKFAPRKTCGNCNSVNHLSSNCKSVKKATVHVPQSMPCLPAMPVMPGLYQNTHFSNPYVNMPCVPNPYMNMPQMTWNIPSMSNMYANFPMMHAPNTFANELLSNPNTQASTPKVKNAKSAKSKANKKGPKETWVPKST